jgi:tetratricopeptide (TPR) repeat protein
MIAGMQPPQSVRKRLLARRRPVALAASAIVFLAGWAALGDVVTLKRGGRRVEGTIIRETDAFVEIQTPDYNFRLDKADIEEITREQASNDEEREGDRLARKGHYIEALEQYEKALAGGADAQRVATKIEGVQAALRGLKESGYLELVEDARKAKAEGDYGTAITVMNAVTANEPDGPRRERALKETIQLHFDYAMALKNVVRHSAARRQLRKTIELEPAFKMAYLELADLLKDDPRSSSEAQELYAKGLSLAEPPLDVAKDCHYRYNWARLQYQDEEYRAAVENFNQVFEQAPSDFPQALEYIVNAYIKIGEVEAARSIEATIQALTSAIERAPSAHQARFELAKILYKAERYAEGIQTLRDLLEYDRNFREANYLLARCCLGAGDLDAYRLALIAELEVNPRHYEASCDLAEHLLEGAKYSDALAYFRKGVQINDGPARAHYGAAESMRKLEDFAGAEGECLALIERDPGPPSPYLILGRLYLDQDKSIEADNQFLTVVERLSEIAEEKSPKQIQLLAEAYLSIGEVALRMKSSNKAQENFQKAIDLDPTLSSAYYGLAQAFVETKQLDKAEECFVSALERSPGEPNFFYGMANLYKTHFERPSHALPFYLKYLELGGIDIDNVERYIRECGGDPRQRAEIDVESLRAKIRQRRLRDRLAVGASTVLTSPTLNGGVIMF